MTAINNINQAETITNPQANLDGNTLPNTGKPESELRAAARRHGLTMKELAHLMGVNAGYLSDVANGRRPWTPMMTERVTAVLGGAPGQGIVYRQGGVITGESSYIRERARGKGMTLKALAVVVGVSYGYMTQAARGHKNMSPSVQAKVESALGGPVEIAPARCANRQDSIASGGSTFIREPTRELGISMGKLADLVGVSRSYMSQAARGKKCLSPAAQVRVEAVLDAPVRVEAAECPIVDPLALWDRMDAHGISQNETARRAGISPSLLSQIMNGKRTPSGDVLRRLHEVLFQPTAAELVAPAEVKVLAWKKGGRNGVVVRGAGGPGAGGRVDGGTIRIGGRVPWGAEVEYAYRAGYDSRGRVSVTHLVDERGYAVMLKQREPDGDGLGESRAVN